MELKRKVQNRFKLSHSIPFFLQKRKDFFLIMRSIKWNKSNIEWSDIKLNTD